MLYNTKPYKLTKYFIAKIDENITVNILDDKHVMLLHANIV